MNIDVGGIFSFLLLIADVWAIINVVQSNVSTVMKVVWVVAILVLPLLGFIAWLIFGPRDASARF